MQDKNRLANFIHFETRVHRHLDWRHPLDWLGSQPFLIGEEDGSPIAVLACPPDPSTTAWIRLFAFSSVKHPRDIWQPMWEKAHQILKIQKEAVNIFVIPLHHWFVALLESSGFAKSNEILVLRWDHGTPALDYKVFRGAKIRPMNLDDLERVCELDQSAFRSEWQYSESSLQLAFSQSSIATVTEIDGEINAYQISSSTPMGGHIARLAVNPEYQGKGLGFYLLMDTVNQFIKRSAQVITVNTQEDNTASLGLYKKAGFTFSGEEFPVYQYNLIKT